ncbi:E2F-associated phosphoprotein isoform X2 [Asparagus officinalis]|uniref:E2F-associated phosphoprotein isoform X2 n=1 Tax=Asparagus officinalis TaxID=4686 RepID=UPI00098E47C5|nr:E2F-associated phosphoprotein isoform X2 [Asparagus officinalis]
MAEGKAKEAMETEPESTTIDPRDIISSDDEIDYSIKPEFYDPNLDEKDELWVHKQRKGRTSDAVLSCPACFTTLCLDCQRHEKYVNQYRAMFVTNCSIRRDQILRQPKQKPRMSRRRVDAEKDVVFYPVCCSVCATEVGVFDEDEIYHFFDVIPSNS